MRFLIDRAAGSATTTITATITTVAMVLGLAAMALSGCGGEALLELSPAAAEGRAIANSRGCAACHGKSGQGVSAPTWQGLYGTQVSLESGETVTVDDEYLHTATVDPQAQVRKGWTNKMPTNSLTDDEVDLIITYIKELS